MGASRHTFELTVRSGGTERRMVLQLDREGAPDGTIDVATQTALVRAAAGEGVPVAEVVAYDSAPAALGAPFALAAHVEGTTLPRTVLRDPAFAGTRRGFAAECGRILAALHRTPRAALPPLDAGDQLDHVVSWIDRIGDPLPAFELAIGWLRRNRPAPVPPAVVHGDFRLGNLIMGPDGVRAVLDWEMAHLGDPAEDLAWLTLRPWRFRGSGEVGGMGDRADLLAAYEAAAGTPPDPARFHWWEVLGMLKWGLICQRQARTHLDGVARSVELAAIGRRVCETEYDLLGLIS
ncbi:phosphotransferase family protein [Actinomadura craniellae]|uniref:Phosphotransferase family protein n=2 Tax=Actinomadura craniellae TaxID=2231787 RepID=A0A365GZ67_9ACTN|nr:phosphotransferase family protein [Actinomadura craniellae]